MEMDYRQRTAFILSVTQMPLEIHQNLQYLSYTIKLETYSLIVLITVHNAVLLYSQGLY